MTDTPERELTADLIFAYDDLVIEPVSVPEWGGLLYVRGLTGEERDAFESSMVTTKGKKREVNVRNLRAGLVARTACDKAGKRLFTDSQVGKLGTKSAAALDRVYGVASRLSGLSAEDEEELVETFPDASD